MMQATSSEGFKVEIVGLVTQQKADKRDFLLVAYCIPYVQPICHVDSKVYTSFSTDCNSLISHMFSEWLRERRMLGKR